MRLATRILLLASLAAAVLAAGFALTAYMDQVRRGEARLPGAVSVGGPFRLTSHLGRPFSSEELKGKPYAVFFGFTHCPDVCPTTLLEMTHHLKALGPAADRIRVVFITVDAARDTPEHLKAYLASFDARIIGLTGSEAEIDAVAKAFRVIYEKVPGREGSYTYNHTASVYLMDAAGRFAGTLNYQEPQESQLAKLKRLAGVS